MKKSIILKTLIILGGVVVFIFISAGYLFSQNDNKLVGKIVDYNLNSAINSLDKRQEVLLKINRIQMEETIDRISKNSSIFLLDYDTDGLKKSLYSDLKKESIQAILIWDSTIDEIFLLGVKENNYVLFKGFLPKHLTKFTKFKQDIVHIAIETEEKIGEITLFYDESIIINQINTLKNESKNKIDAFNKEIRKQQSDSNSIKIYIALGALFTILAVSSILLFIFVNNPLQILQNGLNDFFLFLQNKKDNAKIIKINSNDEFGQMAKSLNENISVSAKLHEEIHELNSNLETRIEEKTNKVTTLLNNAGQGFLTFDENFNIDNEYSKECIKLLGDNLASKNILDILFKDNQKKELFKTTLLSALKEIKPIIRKSYLSLLPSLVILNRRAIKLEYKILDNNKYMLVLTNITAQKKLEKKMQKEQEIMQMIVAIVSEPEIFHDTKKEYISFINSYKERIDFTKTPLHNTSNIYRTIHTFKGSFSQLYIQDIVTYLHQLENNISNLSKDAQNTNNKLLELLDSCTFYTSLDKSIEIIKEILGDEFLQSNNYLKIDYSDIINLQEKIKNILNTEMHTTPECQDILSQVQSLSSLKLSNLLQPYIALTKQLANRLEKEIYDFDIIGDDNIFIQDRYKPFIKVLVHLFRNCVDHGIEIPETRVNKEKDEIGTISCNFKEENNNLCITIGDDGAGIDINKIKEKLSIQNIDTSQLSNNEIYQYIFHDNFTTKDTVTDISGRGVGMSAVKNELEILDGIVKIDSKQDIGTSFEFIIPKE